MKGIRKNGMTLRNTWNNHHNFTVTKRYIQGLINGVETRPKIIKIKSTLQASHINVSNEA